MSTAASLITFAEFEQLPYPEAGKMELVNGEVIIMPPPVHDHAIVAKRIMHFLTERLGWDRVWPDHTGYRIGSGWLEPDVSISWPDQRQDEKYFVGSPMVAIEILSPHEETESKISIYLHGGAREVWIVNSKLKMLVVYTANARIEVTDQYRSEVIGHTITVADIFG